MTINDLINSIFNIPPNPVTRHGNIINNNNPYTIDELNNPMHSSYPYERSRDRNIGIGLTSPHMTQQGENYNTEAVQNQYKEEWKDFTIYSSEEEKKKYLQRKEMNNTSMPISELIKKMAIDAVETLRPKENKTVIELPDLKEMIGLLGNFRPEGNAVMQPQVSDMPSYDMMLADNSQGTLAPLAEANQFPEQSRQDTSLYNVAPSMLADKYMQELDNNYDNYMSGFQNFDEYTNDPRDLDYMRFIERERGLVEEY